MISIYLLTKKESIYFLNFICIQFSKKLFTLRIKRIYYEILIWTQKLFLLENNEFLQFYLQKYLDSFSFKRVIFTNYLK